MVRSAIRGEPAADLNADRLEATTMPRTITWLHLSDLHACQPNTGWDAHRVLDSLRRDLRKMHEEHGLVPDLIFFTGDAAFGHIGTDKGKAIGDQFRAAHEFLTSVRKAFSPEISQRNVFLVPGNHDVNRTRITRFLSNWLEQDPPRTEKERKRTLAEIEPIIRDAGPEWKQLMERLFDYRKFLEADGYDHLVTMPDYLFYADMREVAGVRIGIGGFNSAWSSRGTGRDEVANLWMAGRFQLETILRELPPHELRIALIHHPGNWLVPEENQSPKFFDELQRDFAFVLHGHEHDQFVHQDASNHHAVISAGACHEWSTGKNNGYSFVRLNLETAEGEVWLREYESHGGGWRPRVVTGKTNNDGLWPLSLTKLLPELSPGERTAAAQVTRPVSDRVPPLSPEADYEARYRKAVVDRLDHMQLFGIDVPRDSKDYPLSIAFVSVSLADDEAEEADADDEPPPDANEGDFVETSLPAEAFFGKLSGTRRLLIRGAAGCGKTTLLRWAAVQAGKGDGNQDWRQLVPFLIRLRDYPNAQLPRPHDFPLLLAKELPDAPAGWMPNLLDEGRALVLFDGVDELPEAKRAETIAEIRQLLTTYPRIACVVTSRAAAVERGDFAALGFLTARVEALTSQDRNELIERWHQAMESHLRQRGEAVDLRALAERLKRRLEQTPAVARLTVNPLLCAVVCALHRDREENLPDTPVGLCEKLAEMLLDRRDKERPGIEAERAEDPAYRRLKYAQRKGLLARLAHHMVSTGQSAVPEVGALEQIRAGLQSYQLEDLHAERILQLLLERSGLLQESSGQTIEFLHNTLKEFLAAERFTNGGEVQVLADHCHDEAWQPVILFAIALPREGSDFATQLVRAIRDQTPLQSPEQGRTAWQRKSAAAARAKQFFFFRCCVTAHQINDATIQAQFRELKNDLLPPRSLMYAEALATCGEAVVPYLACNKNWPAQHRAACVRTLRLIGGPLASQFIAQFMQDETAAVRRELALSVEDPFSIPGTVEWVGEWKSLPTWIDRKRVSSVSRLAGLTSLQTLNLARTQVSDVSPLAGLASLQTLRLYRTPVSDVSPLAGLTSLQTLNLTGTRVSDVSPLAGLTSLQTLDLDGTPVSDVSPLAGLTSLQTLDLDNTRVSDVSPLAGLTSLQTLRLYGTQVSDVSTLKALVKRGLKIYGLGGVFNVLSAAVE
ncbi:MAG TPA: leucine-rich repeat domain-containing protein [Kofleriaceae bacterium]|nr:leucine-rich repeat domain-containing protein [Kofleriaceae bacterium]